MKRQIPLMIVIVLGFIFFFQAIIPHKISQDFRDEYLVWLRTMSPFGVVLGIFSIFSVHITKIRRKAPHWGYSFVTLFGLIATAGSGFIWGVVDEGTPYKWLFEYVQMPMSSTMFALLAFYIASAAYKAFRARSAESTVLLLTAIIVMLGQVPVGAAISNFFPEATQWFLNVPNLAAKRGIALGVGMGMTATSLKIILGIERTYLGND